MNRDQVMKTLRENLYLVSTLTHPPMVMDIEKLVLAYNDPGFDWDSLGLMITLQGKEAYELAKELCPRRRSLALPDGSSRVFSESEGEGSLPKLIDSRASGEVSDV